MIAFEMLNLSLEQRTEINCSKEDGNNEVHSALSDKGILTCGPSIMNNNVTQVHVEQKGHAQIRMWKTLFSPFPTHYIVILP